MEIQDNPAFQEMWNAIPGEAREHCKIMTRGSPDFVRQSAPGFSLTVFGNILFRYAKEDMFGDAHEVGYLYLDWHDDWQWVWNPTFKAKIQKAKVE